MALIPKKSRNGIVDCGRCGKAIRGHSFCLQILLYVPDFMIVHLITSIKGKISHNLTYKTLLIIK